MPSDKNAAGSHLGSSSSKSLALLFFSDLLQPFCFSCLSSFDENIDTYIFQKRGGESWGRIKNRGENMGSNLAEFLSRRALELALDGLQCLQSREKEGEGVQGEDRAARHTRSLAAGLLSTWPPQLAAQLCAQLILASP